MTNGEKLVKVFPDIELYKKMHGGIQIDFDSVWWNTEYKEPTTKNDIALIHTEGLDEEIRCTMCTNTMKSDRGCDGSCVVNKGMYKAVMDAIEKRIQPTTKNDLGVDAISREKAIKWAKFYTEIYDAEVANKEIMKMLREMPSVTPQELRWIPVSERLPKIADVYRVTRYYPNNVMNPNYLVDACFFDGSNTWYNDNRINHERAYADNVIAWQENPEPYKAKSEDKE